MARKSRSPQQTRVSEAERHRRSRLERGLDSGTVADARQKRERDKNRERQKRFQERRRLLLRGTVPEGDTGHEREPNQKRQQRCCAGETLVDTDGARCSLPPMDDALMDIVSDEDPIPSHTHFTRQHAQNERERDATRERVRRFCERQQAPLGDTLLLDDGTDADPVPVPLPPAPLLPPYLPVHQQHAIHDFLDRLLVAGDDLHECTVCLEKYHGMPLHTSGTVCARCHNEVMYSYIHVVRFRATLTT